MFRELLPVFALIWQFIILLCVENAYIQFVFAMFSECFSEHF